MVIDDYRNIVDDDGGRWECERERKVGISSLSKKLGDSGRRTSVGIYSFDLLNSSTRNRNFLGLSFW